MLYNNSEGFATFGRSLPGGAPPAAELGRMHYTIDGAQFEVLDEGRGTPIVLLHGFPLAKETWDAQAAALAHHARVIRYDQRGLGTTTVTPGPYLMEQLAGDLAEILDALSIERAVLAGHSMGGYVALAFFRMFAERVAGLALVASRAGADTPEHAALRYALADRAEREHSMAAIADFFYPKYFAPGFAEAHPGVASAVRAIVERTDPAGAAAALRGIAERVSSTDLYGEFEIPLLAIAGAQDRLMDLAEIRGMTGAVPTAELEVLDCGHFPMYEAPDDTTRALRSLVERCGAIAAAR